MGGYKPGGDRGGGEPTTALCRGEYFKVIVDQFCDVDFQAQALATM